MSEDGRRPLIVLEWPELTKGILIRRYKRFLAEVKLDCGDTVTAHCPNSGRMLTCSEPGRPVYLSFHSDPRRKLSYTWELIQMPNGLVGVNTLVPNRLLYESVKGGVIPELRGYAQVKKEVTIPGRSRIDLLLEGKTEGKCFVEVKNCTFVREHIAAFPDAVTARGLKHLIALRNLHHQGHRCVIFYLVQRMDAAVFRPADSIHPEYGAELRKAVHHGVEALAYQADLNLQHIALAHRIPIDLSTAPFAS